MVLVGAGAVDHTQLADLGHKHFGKLSDKYNVTMPRRHQFTGSAVHLRNESLPTVHAAVAMETIPWSSPDYFVFMLLQAMVGSWDRSLGGGKNLSSRACERIATEELAHSMMSFNTCYHTTGLFGLYIVGEQSKMETAIKAVMDEWVRIALRATEMDVERAKSKLKSSFLMQLDGTSAIAEDIGRQMLTLGRRLSPAEIFFRIEAIDMDVVKSVATKYFIDRDPAVAALGPVDSAQFPDYYLVRSFTNETFY